MVYIVYLDQKGGGAGPLSHPSKSATEYANCNEQFKVVCISCLKCFNFLERYFC